MVIPTPKPSTTTISAVAVCICSEVCVGLTSANDQLCQRVARDEKGSADNIDAGADDHALPSTELVAGEHARQGADDRSEIDTGVDDTFDQRSMSFLSFGRSHRVDLGEHAVEGGVGDDAPKERLDVTARQEGRGDDEYHHERLECRSLDHLAAWCFDLVAWGSAVPPLPLYIQGLGPRGRPRVPGISCYIREHRNCQTRKDLGLTRSRHRIQ